MSSSVNKVILVGRLGADPTIRQAGEQNVANIRIATDESYKDRNGEKQKKVEWHSLVVWGKAVDNFVEPFLHKGDMIYVEGKIQSREWTDKDGNAKTSFEINVTDIKGLVTARTDDKPSTKNKPSGTRPAQTRQQQAPPEVSDEDIPF